MGGTPAFKIHGFAAVGLVGFPGDEIEFAFSADDGSVWLHGSGLWMKMVIVFLVPQKTGWYQEAFFPGKGS
jgi:hypothetical protein